MLRLFVLNRYPTRAGPFRPQIDVLYNQAVLMDQGISSDSDLGIDVTVLVIGPSGGGKTSVIRNLLYPGFGVRDSFAPGPTNKIAVYSGDVMGVHFTFIDTPGRCNSSEQFCMGFLKVACFYVLLPLNV